MHRKADNSQNCPSYSPPKIGITKKAAVFEKILALSGIEVETSTRSQNLV